MRDLRTIAYTVVTLAMCAASMALEACGEDLTGCVWWTPDEPAPGHACTTTADCGNVRVCIHASCVGGACVYDNAPVGMPCDQCDVTGSCNASGECIEADAGPVVSQ